MLKSERQALILKQINLESRILSSGYSNEINVYEDIRQRELNVLYYQKEKIIKV